MTHGTRHVYNRYGCRCVPCRQAQADHDRARYRRDPEKHRAEARARMKRIRWGLEPADQRSA